MLNSTKRGLVMTTDYGAFKAELGKELNSVPNCVKGIYDFSKVGGATGDHVLVDDDGNPVKIPSGALIRNVVVVVDTLFASGGAATIDLNGNAANDLLAAEAVASFAANAKLQCIPDFATVADQVLLTAERTLTMSVNTAALTAGKMRVFVDYVF